MSRPVWGHLTMTAPIGLSPGFCRCGHSIRSACEDRLTQPRQEHGTLANHREDLVHAWVSFHQENVRGSKGPHPSELTPFGEGESARYDATAPSPRCSKNRGVRRTCTDARLRFWPGR